MSDIAQEFAMSMYASTADRNAAMLAEIERLRAQLHLAEVVRAAQVEGLTQGAAGWRERANQLEAEVAGLRETLTNTRQALERANTTPNGPICDTIWYSNHETLFDYIDAALAERKGEA